jgi:hypothetical protein
MAYQRRQYGPVSVDVPPGLFDDDEATPGLIAAFTAIAPATLRIRKADLAGAPDLATAMAALCRGAIRTVTATGTKHTWPGLAADLPGDPHCVHYLFESRGEAWHGVAQAPADLWADYGPFLEGVMCSLDIGAKPQPTLPLTGKAPAPQVSEKPVLPDPVEEKKRRLTDASTEAIALILALRFEEAETRLRAIDADIYGANALAHAYETALERAPADARIYTRALHWARSTFPDPHTAIEAEQFGAAIADAEERLRRIHRPD